MPALPLDEAGQYVAAAYLVFVVVLLAYLAIIGAKLARIERELTTLSQLADQGSGPANAGNDPRSSQ